MACLNKEHATFVLSVKTGFVREGLHISCEDDAQQNAKLRKEQPSFIEKLILEKPVSCTVGQIVTLLPKT